MSNQLKPSILTCFGEIAQAILGNFETYLAVVAQVLQQATSVLTTTEGSYEMQDYLDQLLDGIMDAWSGIIIAVRESGKRSFFLYSPHSRDSCIDQPTEHLLRPYVESIFDLLRLVQQDHSVREDTVRAALGILG